MYLREALNCLEGQGGNDEKKQVKIAGFGISNEAIAVAMW